MTLNLRHTLDGRLAGLALLGAAHALSFAPGPLPPWALPYIQIFTLAILAYQVLRAPTTAAAAKDGFAFGFGNFACGLYWLYISMHFYGGMALPLAISAVILLAAALALYSAGATALTRWLTGRQTALPCSTAKQLLTAAVWASSWTLMEWLRGTLFTGFPWLNIGYGHIEGVLAPWAPVVGVYGVAWLAAFASAAIALLACAKDTQNDARAAISVGVAIVSGLVGIGLGHVGWTKPQGDALILRLVQGNVPQSEKFDPALMQKGIATYLDLAALPAKTPESSPALIVLPETVMPIFQDSIAPATWQKWLDVAASSNAGILMGIPLRDQHGGTARYTNSAIAFDSSTSLQELTQARPPHRYDKHHLVPFGEFIPPGFRWFVDAMNIPLGDFDRGEPRQPLFQLGDQRIAPDICYEDVFGEEIIRTVQDHADHGPGASILINMSNLAWFGDSWSLRQHLQISRMRALETGRPMIRATNTGMTAAIGPTGDIRAALPPQSIGVLDVEVQGMTGLTPYVKWGNLPALALSLLVLLWAFFIRRRTSTCTH